MALLTNKPEDSARKVLAHCGLAGFFGMRSSATGPSPENRIPAACAGS